MTRSGRARGRPRKIGAADCRSHFKMHNMEEKTLPHPFAGLLRESRFADSPTLPTSSGSTTSGSSTSGSPLRYDLTAKESGSTTGRTEFPTPRTFGVASPMTQPVGIEPTLPPSRCTVLYAMATRAWRTSTTRRHGQDVDGATRIRHLGVQAIFRWVWRHEEVVG